MAQYIFGGNTGETPQSVARKRALAEAIMGRSLSPQNVGEGFGAIADGIVANITNQRADAAEQAGTASAQDAFTKALMGDPSALGGYGPATASPDASSSPVSFSGDQQEFVNALLPSALEASKRTGIDPRIIIAQSAQETGWGRHAPGNNFFGIKSHGMPGGNTLATDEEVNGRRIRTQDSFRAYDSPEDSVAGYADFILSNPRYSALRNARGLDAQLQALGESGYATGSEYLPAVSSIARSLNLPDVANTPEQATTAMAAGQPFPGGGSLPPQQSGPDLNELLMLSANPWLSEGQRGAINTMIETQLKQQDPAYQLGLEKSQLEIDALRNPTPKDTDDIREYNFAVGQGYQGSFADFQKDMRKAGATNISVGPNGQQFAAAPFGQDYRRNPDGSVWVDPQTGLPEIVTVPNGPQDEKARLAQEQQAAGQTSKATSAGIVVDDIDRALQQIDANPMLTTGMGAAVTKGLPGLPAYQTNALIDTVKANAGFDRLQAMRDASPTGGALGQVSEQENKLLQAAIGNLDPGQDTAQLQYNLKRVSNIYRDIIDGKGNGPRYNLDTGELEQPGSSRSQKSSIDYSAPTAPEGWSGDPALWKFMSPEDRALWQ